MVHQPDDRANAEITQQPEPLVRPAPVDQIGAVRSHSLPQRRIPQCADAELRELLQVVRTPVVAGPRELIEPAIADAIDRALDAAPHFEAACSVVVHAALTTTRRAAPDNLQYSVSACATH